jgi:DNA-binding NarL/FixJ family response regulator
VEQATFRVLVVEDYESWRRTLCSALHKQPELQVIGEVSDGLEAVEKAQELQPDLILLDIGLPRLNGIEAARRIRSLSPQSKILFVSQETSPDIVQGALATGARGYVVKSDANRELLPAVKAVLQGRQFVSARLTGRDSRRATDSQVSDGANEVRATHALTLLRKVDTTLRHEVGFYSDDRRFLDDVTQFIGATLKAENAAIVVATEAHRNSLFARLQAHGLDIAAAIEQGRYVALDAAETLSAFMVNDMPDPGRFLELLGDLIVTATDAAKGEHPRVSVFGECVHLLWAQGKTEAAIQMEKLGNHLTKIHGVDILCGYSIGSVPGEMDSHTFERICAEHTAVHTG